VIGLTHYGRSGPVFKIKARENEMEPGTSPVPILVALIVAVIGATVLFRMDFLPHGAVRNDGINKISRAALARAGATETPTQPNE